MNSLKAALVATATLMSLALPAQARDLTVVSWGGNYQDAQRKIYFQPFSAKLGAPVLDESWDGGYGVLQAKVKAGVPNWDAVQVEAEELELKTNTELTREIHRLTAELHRRLMGPASAGGGPASAT